MSNIIHQKTLRGGANFLVCSPTVGTILESIPGFAADTDGDAAKATYAFGVQKVGCDANTLDWNNPSPECELAIKSVLAKHQSGVSLAATGQHVQVQKAEEAGCDVEALDWRNAWHLVWQRRACLAPVPAEKRHPDDPDSFIPSVFSRLYASPSTSGVEDLELGPYTGQGKILVYTTSKYLVEMANGLFFNSGVHTSELLLPLYHLARAGFDQFEFVTRDGLPVALEEWTFPLATAGDGFPAFEDKLRATAATHREAMNSPKRSSEIPKDLSGYLGIFIPGGHGPLVEFHLDSDLGALLRQAHASELPIMTLCHGLTSLRAAALGGEFPFVGYKTKVFPDATDDQSPDRKSVV